MQGKRAKSVRIRVKSEDSDALSGVNRRLFSGIENTVDISIYPSTLYLPNYTKLSINQGKAFHIFTLHSSLFTPRRNAARHKKDLIP